MPNRKKSHKIIVIGGSSGGLEAIMSILSKLDKDFSIPMVFVLHQQRSSEHLLAKVLSSHTALKVKEPDDKEPIRPGHLYVAPPDYHLLIEPDFTLSYAFSEPVNYSRPSIDVFFESAAASQKNNVIGILLTGANHDGAKGLLAIQTHGGMAIVQDPATAAFNEMPMAAINLGCNKFVKNLEEISSICNTLNREPKN